MLEKLDAPLIPDGYGVSLGYQCLLDIVQSICAIIQNTPLAPGADSKPANSEESRSDSIKPEDKARDEQLINSSWCGLLAALSLLLDAR